MYQIILFWNDTLHVSDGRSVHHQEFKTVHAETGICHTDTAVCFLAGTRWNCTKLYKNKLRETLEEACSPDSMICTRDCNYSFMCS